MSNSYTTTDTATFTVTHARHLAAKVATDMKRLQRFYGEPSDARIAEYEGEVTELLRQGFLGSVAYGYQRNDNWIEPTLRYTAKELTGGTTDDDPGRIRPGANVVGASFRSYLTYSSAWYALTAAQRETIAQQLPIKRIGANEPQVEGGYFEDDKTYSAGGRSLGRSSVRSY